MALGVNSHWAPQTQVRQVIFKVFLHPAHSSYHQNLSYWFAEWFDCQYTDFSEWSCCSVEIENIEFPQQKNGWGRIDKTSTWTCVGSTIFFIRKGTEGVIFFPPVPGALKKKKRCFQKFLKRNSQIFSEEVSRNCSHQNRPIKEAKSY